MQRMIVIAAGLLTSLAGLHVQAASQSPEEETESLTEAANTLGDCSGYYEALARMFELQKKPATAERFRGLARGAQHSAVFIFSLVRRSERKKEIPIDNLYAYVDARVENNLNRVASFMEMNDEAGLKAEQDRCSDSMPLQMELVQKIKEHMLEQ